MFTNMRSIAAILAVSSLGSGHMIMQSPKPFGGPDLDNSPLTSSNYPCKVKGDPAAFYKDDLGNTIAVGETQQMSFKGSAVHGGGSCQLAITDDLQPSASTSWKVIQSIQGGCPSKSGSGPDTYDWTVPDGIAPGKYVFAWTWISKLAGQPEYYMNCAPLTVTGGKSKRADNQTSSDSYPELFVANLAEINDCKTAPSTDVEFPDPGTNVKQYGNPAFGKVTGSNCVPKGAKSGGSSGNSGSGSSSGGEDKSGPSAAPASNVAPSSTGASKSLPTAFITSVRAGGSSSATASATSTTQTASQGPTSVEVDPICTPSETASPSSASPSSASPVSSTNSAAPVASSSPAGSNSSAGGLTGACTEEGTFNCIGGTSYQQCASGQWSTVMQLAATVKCTEGMSMTLWRRDESPLRRLRRRAH